jgi:hypothetical protein
LEKPDVPTLDPVENPIDVFINVGLGENGLHPLDATDKRTLIRRATFDLIGLPPTLAEIDVFLADESNKAFNY